MPDRASTGNNKSYSMSLKTISLISVIILALVFVWYLVRLCSILQRESLYEVYTWCQIMETILWLPFILFFWKIYKG